MFRPVPAILALSCSFVAGAVIAASPPNSAPDTSVAQQQLRDEMQSLLTQLATSGALGQDPRSLNLRVRTPAHRVTDLGVVVDSEHTTNPDPGLRIVATTPGSTAARAGLRPGDLLLAVNGTSLRKLGRDDAGRPLAVATLKSTVADLPDSAPLHLQVKRDGRLIDIDTKMHSVYVPAMQVALGSAAVAATGDGGSDPAMADSGCGRISTFDVAPRGKRLYHARIMLLDGQSPNSRQQNYRVDAGEHTLVVAEDIPTLAIGVGEIATLRKHTRKTLHVDVKPNTTVMVAAKLHLDKVTRLTSGEYWDPVVWRVTDRACP